MAVINVDHSRLEKTASAVDDYVTKHKHNMNSIDTNVTALKTAWEGEDYDQMAARWQQMNSDDSTSGEMLKALESYADFLRFAAEQYKTAQIDAINRANRLPKW